MSNLSPQDTADGGEGEGDRQEEEEDDSEGALQEETGDSEDEWHQEERYGNRLRCQICGYTRNTRYQLDRYIQERHEENNDRSHENNGAPQIICDLCNKQISKRRELTNHLISDHKSKKPCDGFREDRCDLDDECRFRHIKLKQGEEICYKCGKIFQSKRDLLSHIEQIHGHEICHRYLRNECTARRCLFTHSRPTTSSAQERTTPVSAQL